MDAPNPEKFYIYITDPMLATGNSLIEAIKLYADKGIPIDNIKVICIIAAPQGIENIQKHYPEIEIITAAVDECLNEKGISFQEWEMQGTEFLTPDLNCKQI